MEQVITITLKLEDGQPPYTNAVEQQKDTPYDHLKQFFEELDPPYKVVSVKF